MKKVILASVVAVCAVSGTAQAAGSYTICAGTGVASPVSSATDGTLFVRASFAAKCSNNVYLAGDDQMTFYRAGAASLKGKTGFGLSSAGGGFTTAACAATGCTATNASVQAVAAPSS